MDLIFEEEYVPEPEDIPVYPDIQARREKRRRARIRRVVILVLAAGLLITAVGAILPAILNKDRTGVYDSRIHIEWTIENRADILAKLDEEIWKTLPREEKLEVLNAAGEIEACHLRMEWDLTIEAVELPEGVYASYYDKERKIRFSEKVLDEASPYDCVVSIAHEVYHAYTYRVIDAYDQLDEDSKRLLFFSDIERMKSEFEHYAGSYSKYQDYYNQVCEQQAREYSEERAKLYFVQNDSTL